METEKPNQNGGSPSPSAAGYLPERPQKPLSGAKQTFCQIGTTGKGLPCLVNINTLAGLVEACEVCRPHLQQMRDMMGWVPFRGKYFMSNKLADFQHDALLDRIGAAAPASQGDNDQAQVPR